MDWISWGCLGSSYQLSAVSFQKAIKCQLCWFVKKFKFAVPQKWGSAEKYCQSGGIGRRTGLKIQRSQGCAGSTPASGTTSNSTGGEVYPAVLKNSCKEFMNALAGTPASGTLQVKSDASTCWRSAMCYSSATEWKVKNGCCGHEYHKHAFFRQSFLTKKSKILKHKQASPAHALKNTFTADAQHLLIFSRSGGIGRHARFRGVCS